MWGTLVVCLFSYYAGFYSWLNIILNHKTPRLKDKQYEKYKGVRIDLQTANLLTTVHSKVNNKMRSILTKLGDQNIKQLINTLWAIAK